LGVGFRRALRAREDGAQKLVERIRLEVASAYSKVFGVTSVRRDKCSAHALAL
jgi:hypothetical protein